jgi:hypothetical protein
MDPNVITNSCKGDVSLQFRALGVKCEEMGFKNPSNAFYSKATSMSAKHNTQYCFKLKNQASKHKLFSMARIHPWRRSTVGA